MRQQQRMPAPWGVPGRHDFIFRGERKKYRGEKLKYCGERFFSRGGSVVGVYGGWLVWRVGGAAVWLRVGFCQVCVCVAKKCPVPPLWEYRT